MTLNVLIVEDEVEFREYLSSAIPWERYQLHVAGAVADLEPARKICRTHRIDLVLLDISLQTGNGLDLVPELRRLQSAPRIIVVTGHEEFETVRTALRLGVDDYLLKPFAKHELSMSVLSNRDQVLEHRKQERTEASLDEAIVDSWLYQWLAAASERERLNVEDLLRQYRIEIPAAPHVLLCCALTDRDIPDQAFERRLEAVRAAWKTTVEPATSITWRGLDDRIYVLLSGVEPSELAWEAQDMAEEFVRHGRFRVRWTPTALSRAGMPWPNDSSNGSITTRRWMFRR